MGAFRDLVRRTFGLILSDKELGYVIRKYDKKGDQTITCKPFLTSYLRLGQTRGQEATSAARETA